MQPGYGLRETGWAPGSFGRWFPCRLLGSRASSVLASLPLVKTRSLCPPPVCPFLCLISLLSHPCVSLSAIERRLCVPLGPLVCRCPSSWCRISSGGLVLSDHPRPSLLREGAWATAAGNDLSLGSSTTATVKKSLWLFVP